MRNNFSVLFKLKIYVICTERAHQNAKFWTFDCPREISPICTLIGSFCGKYARIQLKRYRGVISHDSEE